MSEPSNGPSLQQRFGATHICFGCGPSNTKGLRIQSYPDGDDVVCTWTPEPHHQAFAGVLAGGIVGTLLDCHSNWTAAWHLMQSSGEDKPPCTVTAQYSVKLLRPAPVNGPVRLRARVTSSTPDRATVEASLEAGGQVCATCTGLFVAVKPGHPAYNRW